jgi:hypothetical protein
VTLANQTADLDVSPFVHFVQSTVWNWARNEACKVSLPGVKDRDDDSAQSHFQHALMEASTSSNGSCRRVEYCNIRHRAACRRAK